MREAMPWMFLARHREHGPDVDRLAVSVGAVSAPDVLEVRRQNANDFETATREVNGPPDDGGVAVEAPLPQPVAQDHDVFAPGQFVIQLELTAEQWLIAEQLEE